LPYGKSTFFQTESKTNNLLLLQHELQVRLTCPLHDVVIQAKVPWSLLDIFDDAEDKLYAFNLLFNNILDKHAPIKMMKICGRPNPYVTEEIGELMRTIDNWKKIAKKSKDSYAWLQNTRCAAASLREKFGLQKGNMLIIKFRITKTTQTAHGNRSVRAYLRSQLPREATANIIRVWLMNLINPS